jgi:hypothetical protein
LCHSSESIAVPVAVKLTGFVSPVVAARIVAAAKDHALSLGADRVRKEFNLLELLFAQIKQSRLAVSFPSAFPGESDVHT